MYVYGELKKADLENLGSDVTAGVIGRIYWNTATLKSMLDDGTNVRAFLRNDGYAVFGNNGTAGNNIRFHRGAAAVLQFVTGGDTTAEGSLSTSLAQLSFKFEAYATGSLPAAGAAGRIAWDTTTTTPKFDTGAAWFNLSPLTTKGDVYTFSTVPIRLAVGTNDQYLAADSAQVTGLKWASLPLTTRGDLFTRDASANARLAIGAANTVLFSNATDPAWGKIVDAYIDSAAAIALSKLAALSFSVAVVTTGAGVLTTSATTATEVGYLSGVTSALQGQIDYKDKDVALTNNLSVACSVSAGALTIALKQLDGTTDPASGTGAVKIAFPSSGTSGAVNIRSATAATSIVLPTGGSTIGLPTGTSGWIYIYALDNSGTVELAVSGTYLGPSDYQLLSTVAVGTGSTSPYVFYSTTARTTKAIRLIAQTSIQQSSVGVWDAVGTILIGSRLSNASYPTLTRQVSKTTTYTATKLDDLINASGSAFTITLPLAADVPGKVLTIKKTDTSSTNIITISRAGSDTIEGVTSITLNCKNEFVQLISDATSNWSISSIRKAPVIQTFTSGATTYTPTPGATYCRIYARGGGAGGAGSSTTALDGGAGGSGGNTTVGAYVTANGATGASGGNAPGGSGAGASFSGTGISGTNSTGNGGTSNAYAVGGGYIGGAAGGGAPGGGGAGGSPGSTGGAGAANSGGGGGGAGSPASGVRGASGGGGGYCDVIVTGTSFAAMVATPPTVTIGAGGTAGAAGTSGFAGGAGGSGYAEIRDCFGS